MRRDVLESGLTQQRAHGCSLVVAVLEDEPASRVQVPRRALDDDCQGLQAARPREQGGVRFTMAVRLGALDPTKASPEQPTKGPASGANIVPTALLGIDNQGTEDYNNPRPGSAGSTRIPKASGLTSSRLENSAAPARR